MEILVLENGDASAVPLWVGWEGAATCLQHGWGVRCMYLCLSKLTLRESELPEVELYMLQWEAQTSA